VQTPLAGTAVSLCVVPANAAIPTPGEDHAIVVVGDVTPPSLIAVGSAGVFANPSAATVKGDLVVSFSEYLGPGTPDPVLEIREAGGDPAYVLNPATAQWSWDPGMASGRFRFPVPAGVDGTGDEFRITLSGAVDLSGNTAAADLVSEWALILPIPPVWDFESGPQDWFCADVGRWEWGAPTDGPGSGYQSQSCWGTDLDAYFGFNWDTRLESPPFIVPMADPRVRFVHYADLAYGDYFELIIATEAGEVVLLQYSTDYSVWQQAEISLAPYAGQLCRLVFRFVSNATSNDSGVFVDDVSVTGD